MKFHHPAIAAVTCTAALLAGCGGGSSDLVTTAQLRTLNVSPASGPASVDFPDHAGLPIEIDHVAPGTVSSYVPVTAGGYSLRFTYGNLMDPSEWGPADITVGKHYVLINSDSGGKFYATALQEDDAPAADGLPVVRVLNLAQAEAGNVDVYVTPHPCTSLTTTDMPLAANVGSTVSGLASIGAAQSGVPVNLCVTPTGNKTTTLLARQEAPMSGPLVTTLVLTHGASGTALNGQWLEERGAVR